MNTCLWIALVKSVNLIRSIYGFLLNQNAFHIWGSNLKSVMTNSKIQIIVQDKVNLLWIPLENLFFGAWILLKYSLNFMSTNQHRLCLITRRCWLLNLSRITSSWRASWWSMQSLCLWRVDVQKFVQPADPNGFVFFDLRQNWQSITPFSKRNHVWSSNQHVWNDHAFVVFLSHPHLPLPFLWFVLHRLNYLRHHFVKGLLERSFVWKRKTI